jgi:hypothetical protein
MTLKKLYYAIRPMAALRANERFCAQSANMKRPRMIWGCLIPIVGIMLLPFVGYFLREFRTPEGRTALPAEATNVEEYLAHGFISGDFTWLMKASLSANRYSDYAKSLGLPERFDPDVHRSIQSTLNMRIPDTPVWWNPPEVDSTAYFQYKEGVNYLRLLRYHNGTVYLLELSW